MELPTYDQFDIYYSITYDPCTYVNMDIKRSVRISGTQEYILNVSYHLFKGKKFKFEKKCNFLCIFLKILCIFDLHCAMAV